MIIFDRHSVIYLSCHVCLIPDAVERNRCPGRIQIIRLMRPSIDDIIAVTRNDAGSIVAHASSGATSSHCHVYIIYLGRYP